MEITTCKGNASKYRTELHKNLYRNVKVQVFKLFYNNFYAYCKPMD